ncbi:hypothetical protein K2W90_02820 [Candidatus Babeliales bacterium]|nr:hypothetical protein [Candidatus Babeliales bacterium]
MLKKSMLLQVLSVLVVSSLHASFNFTGDSSVFKISGTSTIAVVAGLTVSDGTFEKDSSASLIGQNVTFSDGTFITDDVAVFLTGDSKLDNQARLILNGNDSFRADQGTVMEAVLVSGKNNKLEGSPYFLDTDAITLQDRNTTLTLAMQSVMSNNIKMNSGSLYLGSNLYMGDGAQFTGGGGRIEFNDYRLVMGGQDLHWSATNYFLNATDLTLNSNVQLTGQWVFDGDSNLNGNGYILDISSGSTLRIKGGTRLTISDLKIKGLGSGFIVFDDNSAGINLTSAEIEMNANYSVTIGGMNANGPTTIATKEKKLTFGVYGTLTVDGIALTYETMQFPDQNNIRFGDEAFNLETLNGGVIRTIRTDPVGGYSFNNETVTLGRHIVLTEIKPMTITGNVTVIGAGNPIGIGQTPNPVIFLNPGSKLTLKETVLLEFGTSNVSFGANSNIEFGNRCKVELGKNCTANFTLTFRGDTVLKGFGYILDLGTTGSIVLASTPGTSLVLADLTIKGISGTNIRAMDRTGTFSIQNVRWLQEATYTMTMGHFDLLDGWAIEGASPFIYNTDRISTIYGGGNMQFGEDTTLVYRPRTNNRQAISLLNSNSYLSFNGTSLVSSTTGLRLTKGTLFIDGVAKFSNSAVSLSQAITFGNGVAANDLTININPAATLELTSGLLSYENTF